MVCHCGVYVIVYQACRHTALCVRACVFQWYDVVMHM